MKQQIEILWQAILILVGLGVAVRIGQQVYHGAERLLGPVLGF